MSRTPSQIAAGVLARTERLLRRGRKYLTNRPLGVFSNRPNNASEWARLYPASPTPVVALNSPIAAEIAGLTKSGDILLETGCGAAAISAELAKAGRVVELADFSDEILRRAENLFSISNLTKPRTTLCDLTRPLPWADGSVDVTWSSGVLEHWTDEELVPIVRELARVSRLRVISLVPYEGCLAYRWGKAVAEKEGNWPYGREIPRLSLQEVFRRAGLVEIQERTIWPEAGLNFLNFVDAEIRRTVASWFQDLPTGDPLRRQQGYLLLTVGEVAARK